MGVSEVTVVYSDGCLFVFADGDQHCAHTVTLKVPAPEIKVGALYDVAVQEVKIVGDDEPEDDDEMSEQALVLSDKRNDGTIEIAWVYSKKDLKSLGISYSKSVLSSHTATVHESCFREPAKEELCEVKMLDHDRHKLRDAQWKQCADVAKFRCGGPRPGWIAPNAADCNVEVLSNPNGPKFNELDALLCAIRTASSRKRSK